MSANDSAGGQRIPPRRRQQQENGLNGAVRNSYSSTGSGNSNFTEIEARRQSVYEPGTGSRLMADAGWNRRDPYGRPRPSVTYTSTVPRQHNPQHTVKFSQAPDYKMYYLIALIIVSLLFLIFFVTIVILFITKVFVVNSGSHSSVAISHGTAPPGQNLPSTSGINEGGTQKPALLKFQIHFFIERQANPAYTNNLSFEYSEAIRIIQLAISEMVETSPLREFNPEVILEGISNNNNDLLVAVRLTISTWAEARSSATRLVEDVFKNQLPSLKIHKTNIDSARISVTLTSQK